MKGPCLAIILVALPTGAWGRRTPECKFRDTELIACTTPEVRNRTELTDGFVVLEFTILKDGSVKDIIVLESDASQHWNQAAIDAIKKWRYKSRKETLRKSLRLEFKLSDD